MKTLFELPQAQPSHPAKYTDALLLSFVGMLRESNRVLDPFGGTGKIFLVNRWLPELQIEALEIEPEWAKLHPRTTQGNALEIPWPDNYFDAICTSPTYGNRMADSLSTGKWERISYADKLGRSLHADNSGDMQWGTEYRNFHIKAWTEARRVLKLNGIFVLNIKDHIRNYEVKKVTEWHIETLKSMGFVKVQHDKIDCPGMRYGDNQDLRVAFESVIKFRLQEKLPANSSSTGAAGAAGSQSDFMSVVEAQTGNGKAAR